jgi:hypothetical protein
VQSELSNLELSSTYRTRRTQSWYTSPVVPEGYTHQGRVIGAAIGPGASSQWLGADWLRPGWQIGLYGGRIRWDNGVFYTRSRYPTYLGHDVSIHAGVRGAVAFGRLALTADLSTASRYNYLFQHFARTADDIASVDIRNRTLRLWLGSAEALR